MDKRDDLVKAVDDAKADFELEFFVGGYSYSVPAIQEAHAALGKAKRALAIFDQNNSNERITLVTANVYRTDATQVAELGRNAFTDMHFNGGISEGAVLRYCEKLAERDGIIEPEIVITTTA